MAPGDLLVAQKSFIYSKKSKKRIRTCEKSLTWLADGAISRKEVKPIRALHVFSNFEDFFHG